MNKESARGSLLVGCDERGCSDEALRAALDLGQRLSTRVHGVHALALPTSSFEGNAAPVESLRRGPTLAEEATRVRELESAFDRIAVGSHGRSGLSAAVLGHVADCLLKGASKPVLAIRHPERQFLLPG